MGAARGVDAALKEQGMEPGASLAADLAGDDDAQAELFAEEMREQARALDKGATPAAWDGVGRKPGSRNKRTAQVVDFIASTGVDPLVFWNRHLSMKPEDLQERYQLKTLGDALAFQQQCADKLAEYVHPKLARIEVKGEISERREIVHLHFRAEDAPDEPDIDGDFGAGGAVDVAFEDITENQALTSEEGRKVAQSEGRTNAPSD